MGNAELFTCIAAVVCLIIAIVVLLFISKALKRWNQNKKKGCRWAFRSLLAPNGEEIKGRISPDVKETDKNKHMLSVTKGKTSENLIPSKAQKL